MIYPKIAIVYLCWADEPIKYLRDALDAISNQDYPKNSLILHVVYNGPRVNEEGFASFIESEIKKRQDNLPETIFVDLKSNIGFSAGNNLGIRQAIAKGAEYVFLHNSDGYLASDTISKLFEAIESDKKIGVCQPLILLDPEKNLINSAGNNLHYLQIGYCDKYRQKIDENLLPNTDIGYASGAGVLMRVDLLNEHGLWNERFFLYHEDTEYSERLRLLGYKIKLVGNAVFYHKYEFKNKPNKFFWIERNRHGLELMFYKWPTLLLLLPLEILFNLGLLASSIFGGWLKELLKVYAYWLSPKNWREWMVDRKIIQSKRTITDRKLLASMTPFISLGDFKAPKIVEMLANFVFTIYWFLIKILIWW